MTTFWLVTLGILFGLYFALGGIDYGVALLLPTLGGEPARTAALNAIGPMFLGNEVWVVAATGVLLAVFPGVESGLFTGTYPVLVTVLLGLVAINAAVQLRGRAGRRAGFDAVITGSGFVLAAGWGVVLGSLLPERVTFGLLTGALALVQGATFLDRPSRRPLALVAAGLTGTVVLVERFGGISLVLAGLLVAALLVVALTRSLVASSIAAALPVFVVGARVYRDLLASASGDHALRVLTIAAVPLLPVLVLVQVAGWWYFRRRPSAVYW
jgi:cytochrome bd ubiquinol oxidase subunit II